MAIIKEIPLQKYICRAYCSMCNTEYNYGSYCINMEDKKSGWLHSCSKCGNVEWLDDIYPKEILKEIKPVFDRY